MARHLYGARLVAAALIACAVAVLGPVAPLAAQPASTDVGARLLVGSVDNDEFDAQYTTLRDRVVFAGFDAHGSQPWITDGTPTGTHRIAVTTEHLHSHLSNLTGTGKQVFFTLVDDVAPGDPWELWVTDGTKAGTRLLYTFPQGIGSYRVPNHLTAVGSRIFFNASSATGRQLWVSDGTKAGTSMVMSFPDDGQTFTDAGEDMAALGDRVYFPAEDGAHGGAHGIELWSSDGTAAGTSMAVDVAAGTTGSAPYLLRAFDHRLYFTASNAGGGIYSSDGTPDGTIPLLSAGQTISGTLSQAQPVGGDLFVPAHAGGANGWMVTDGTADGTTFEPLPTGLQVTSAYAGIGQQVLFGARIIGPDDDEELWSTDGTTGGTHLVKDVYPGLLPSSPSNLTSLGDRAVFDAVSANQGDRLFVSDGTADGTHRLDAPQVEDSATLDVAFRAGLVFFDGTDGPYYQPWVWEPGPRYLSWCTLKVPARVKHHTRPSATAKVGSSASLAGARVTLFDGGKKLGSYPLRKGRATTRLPAGLKIGHHRLTARFAGNDSVDGCTATRTVTVRR
jgi:ELWxxDGT repeat protein